MLVCRFSIIFATTFACAFLTLQSNPLAILVLMWWSLCPRDMVILTSATSPHHTSFELVTAVLAGPTNAGLPFHLVCSWSLPAHCHDLGTAFSKR